MVERDHIDQIPKPSLAEQMIHRVEIANSTDFIEITDRLPFSNSQEAIRSLARNRFVILGVQVGTELRVFASTANTTDTHIKLKTAIFEAFSKAHISLAENAIQFATAIENTTGRCLHVLLLPASQTEESSKMFSYGIQDAPFSPNFSAQQGITTTNVKIIEKLFEPLKGRVISIHPDENVSQAA